MGPCRARSRAGVGGRRRRGAGAGAVAVRDDYFVNRRLDPNVEFYSGLNFTVDGETFVVNDAYLHQEYDALPGLDFIIWDAAGLDWTEGQRISVGLIDSQSVPVLPVPALGILLGLLSAAGYRARRKRVG